MLLIFFGGSGEVVVISSGVSPDLMNVLQLTAFGNNVLSADFSNNVLRVYTTITHISMSQRMGMWGEAMFGDKKILGGAITSAYRDGQLNVRNV